MVTLNQYINFRLGSTPQAQLINFIAKPFTAASFAEFWWYWNPVFGYYLYYYSYKPLQTIFPRWISVWLTFCVCGFIHGFIALGGSLIRGNPPLFKLAVVWFALLGLIVVVSESLELRFDKVPKVFRWPIHLLTIAGCYRVAEFLSD